MLLLSLVAAALAGGPFISYSPTELLDSIWTGSGVVTMRGSAEMRELSRKYLAPAYEPRLFPSMDAQGDLLYEEALDCDRVGRPCAEKWDAAYELYTFSLSSPTLGPDWPGASYRLEMALRCLWHSGGTKRSSMDELASTHAAIPQSTALLLLEGDLAAQRGDAPAADALFQGVQGTWSLYARYRRAWLKVDAGDTYEAILMLEEMGGLSGALPPVAFVADAARIDLVDLYNMKRWCKRGRKYFMGGDNFKGDYSLHRQVCPEK